MLPSTRCPHCKHKLLDGDGRIHDACIAPWYEKNREKLRAKAKKVDRVETKRKLEVLRPTPLRKLLSTAQAAFNAFIHERDKDKGCFVCGAAFPVGQGKGGNFDAGHVRSRGAAPQLRFNEDNCFGECKGCNASWGAKPHELEAGAIRRIGQERWEAVKNNNKEHKWQRDEVLGITTTYRAKLKQLKKQNEGRQDGQTG